MMYKRLVLALAMIFLTCNAVALDSHAQEESDQQISDFSLVGYAEKGKKDC